MSGAVFEDEERISLCEALDRVLHKGVVIQGDITIAVADVDLVYLGLRLVLSSIETARAAGAAPWPRPGGDARVGTKWETENYGYSE